MLHSNASLLSRNRAKLPGEHQAGEPNVILRDLVRSFEVWEGVSCSETSSARGLLNNPGACWSRFGVTSEGYRLLDGLLMI